ncbi:MAG: methyl-accepting chemotaxis protein [Nitrosomonadales bacterium]|jgi:methyl-accepting chemotaxis protein
MSLDIKSISIKTKLSLVIVAVIVGLILISVFALLNEKALLLSDRQVKTQHLVETAHSVLAYHYEMQSKGALTEEQAKAAAMGVIKSLRYDEKEYFWINDMTPVVLMHPIKPELDGKDVSELKDPTGKRLFVEFVEVVKKSGGGIVSYMWSKPGASEPVPKISYVKGFTPWGWVVGSGIYVDDINSIFWESAKWMIGLIAAMSLVGVILLQIVARSITTPLSALQKSIQDIQSTKDLTKRANVSGKDEIGEIAHAFNQMLHSFEEIIQVVIFGVNEVKKSSVHLHHTSDSVSKSSIAQSDSTLLLAAQSEEMLSSIEHIASNTQQTHAVAIQTEALSIQGQNAVRLATDEMSNIANSVNDSSMAINKLGDESKQISEIVKAIKEIADQTNLLALNAAIEAARAGEQGRGFAVVADEVRKLAERTSKSTVDISKMIEMILSETNEAVSRMHEGSRRVTDGVEMANKAGVSMHDIRAGSQQVIVAVSEISNALAEQSAAGKHVAIEIEKVAQMADQNCTSVASIVQTAIHMEDLANTLHHTVSQFRTTPGTTHNGGDLEMF